MKIIRPQERYRGELLNAVQALKPANLLEVGCGGGGFLRSAAHLNAEVHGIDPDLDAINELRSSGHKVQVGNAERLNFPDRSFDAVIFSYTAHHIADWHSALLEALRVSRNAVMVLDPWYETEIASQAVAERFDRWCKEIDRARGMVHNECMSAGQLLAPLLPRLSSFQVTVEYLLDLLEMDTEFLTQCATKHLGATPPEPSWLDELDRITADSRRHGFSDDGAILLTIRKHEE